MYFHQGQDYVGLLGRVWGALFVEGNFLKGKRPLGQWVWKGIGLKYLGARIVISSTSSNPVRAPQCLKWLQRSH